MHTLTAYSLRATIDQPTSVRQFAWFNKGLHFGSVAVNATGEFTTTITDDENDVPCFSFLDEVL